MPVFRINSILNLYTSYFNRDIVTNYWSEISSELLLYRVEIEDCKSYFYYNYETNPEKRLLKIHGEFSTFLFPMSESFGDVVNKPSLV